MEEEEQWNVIDLYNGTHSRRPEPTEEQVLNMLEELTTEWIDQDEYPNPSEMTHWAASRFYIDLDTFTFDNLSTNYRKRVNQVVELNNIVNRIEVFREDLEIKDKILRIGNCMRSAHDCLKEAALLYHRMDPVRELRLPEGTSVESILNYKEDKLNNFQKLLLAFLKILAVKEYRKIEDQCWVQTMNSEGLPTQAWSKETTIAEFLFKSIRKETFFEAWVWLTNPKDNGEQVVKHLVASEQAEFASLEVDRHKWSYDDGIYDAAADTFWVYEEQDLWLEQAQKLQEYRRDNGWGDAYTIEPPDGVCMTVKYFPQPFRFRITPETEATFDPHKIVLPELETIFKSQHLDEFTIDWCLIMLARLFFKVGEKDKWQVVFFIKGVAASGKSTLAKLIRYMYPTNLITTLSSNVEKQFGLSGIYKGLICVCAEVREDFGLNQADWQSAASGEEIQIAVKGKTAFQHLWDTPFFFLGNELPNYKNAAGSVDRRIFIIEFNYKIRDGGDPNLFQKMIDNIDLFHRKSVRMYLEKVREHGDKDIWCPSPALLSQQIYDFKMSMRQGVDCLFRFIKSGVFEFHLSYYMSLADFKTMYYLYRKDNNEDRVKWNKDHYHAVFQEIGINIQKKTLQNENRQVTQEYVVGLQMVAEDIEM
jgi:hypothetical protein